MTTHAMLLDQPGPDRRQPLALRGIALHKLDELIDRRLRSDVARQHLLRLRRLRVDADDGLVVVLDDPDRAVGRNGHPDGSAPRPDAIDLVPPGDQFDEPRGRDRNPLLGLERPGWIGGAVEPVAHRWRIDFRKAPAVDVVEDNAAASRLVAMKSDNELALQLRKFACLVIEHAERRGMRWQQRK